MDQENYQERYSVQKKRSRKKKTLSEDLKLVWYVFAMLAGPVGAVLFVLGNHINNGFLFLLGLSGILVELITAAIVAVTARIAKEKRYWRKRARKM